MGRPRSVIAQGSTSAPIRRSLRLSSKTRRDGIAKCMKVNTQNKENIENAILLESSPLRPRSVIAQGSTPAPIDNVVNDDETKPLKNRTSRELLTEQMKYDIAKQVELELQNEKNIKNDKIKKYLNNIKNPKSIMETLNEKSEKINHEQNDHYYAENTIIDYVNDDCLAEIFLYVPACERQKIAMVCKKWKRALDYSWFNVKKLEFTFWRYYKYIFSFKKYYPTVDVKLSFLKSLLDKCGRYLTILDLTAYARCNIVPIINDYCPNLEKLRLRFILIDDTMLSNAFTRLSKLKSLTIVFQMMRNNIIPETLINSLKNVAGTLTELYLLNFVSHLNECCDYPKNLRYVLCRLKALKRFEVAGIRGFKNSFKYLKYNEMSFYFNHNEYLKKPRNLGDSFINIRQLDLTNYLINDNTLYTIANTMEQLKSLTIPCEQITDDGVVALSMMNYLQVIYLNGHNNVIDSSIKLLKNIVKLSLPHSNKITDVSVMKLLENSLKIKCLLLHYTSLTANFIKKAAEISSQRKQLLKITIHSLIPDVKQYESPYFEIYIIENKKK
ncbi:uncharacterized protein LOC122855916 [Aphidius gifuensis]|uniref:uncharacterized protein LOC122855916 n=1 Tax=Aphidius gifuensis TaxID=684658 RepID=UPI001CDB4B77|nr:uncharacterized protein LOC122855916 [Aphidius gifuensis]